MTFEETRIMAESLIKEGHAVRFDTAVDSNGKQVSASLHHYLTCILCERKRRYSLPSDEDFDRVADEMVQRDKTRGGSR